MMRIAGKFWTSKSSEIRKWYGGSEVSVDHQGCVNGDVGDDVVENCQGLSQPERAWEICLEPSVKVIISIKKTGKIPNPSKSTDDSLYR